MKIGLLGHGVVGGGVRKIIDEKLTDETKNLEITKILVKDVSEITDERMTTDVNEIDGIKEIDRISKLPCMTMKKEVIDKNGNKKNIIKSWNSINSYK